MRRKQLCANEPFLEYSQSANYEAFIFIVIKSINYYIAVVFDKANLLLLDTIVHSEVPP